jgi:tRNA dimethylallyltransferase
MEPEPKPIIVIVGPTASGKSDLAIELAELYGGEIIAADSRTIYKGMDIGTAKPSPADRRRVPHHGLDLIKPNESYSAAEFKKYVIKIVDDINTRGKIPIIAGGSGLYIDGYLYDFKFGEKPDEKLRTELEASGLEDLQARASQLGIEESQVNFSNPRHLARAIERGGIIREHKPLPSYVLLIGLSVNKDELQRRIESRVHKMFMAGLEKEVKNLVTQYGADAAGLLAPGYKAVIEHLDGHISSEEAQGQFMRNDRNLAKRQITWFKRNPDILWCENPQQAEHYVRAFLAKFDTINA